MKKKTFTGWIHKTRDLDTLICRDFAGEPSEAFTMDELFTRRGRKDEWDKDNWPPVKVKVTVEVIK